MDYQPNYQPQVNYEDKRSSGFATASIVLGIVAIATSCCIYSALICGALSIIFALLSRGGELTMSSNAKIGLTLGIIGLVITILIYTFAIILLISNSGGIEPFFQEYDKVLQQYTQYYQGM